MPDVGTLTEEYKKKVHSADSKNSEKEN